jgi:phosphatidylglycerophosphate synthase
LLDGMVAIEGGFRTKSGEIFNEFPDRFADTFIFAGAGYAAMNWEWGVPAGWICALLAVLTAYVRSLGVAAGSAQYFCGPMAKQHRMAAMTFACIASAFLSWFGMQWPVIGVSLIFVGAGSLITVFRRARLIVRELESK